MSTLQLLAALAALIGVFLVCVVWIGSRVDQLRARMALPLERDEHAVLCDPVLPDDSADITNAVIAAERRRRMR